MSTTTTLSKKIRNVRKRLKQIKELESRDPMTLNESQKCKISRKIELSKTLNELLETEKNQNASPSSKLRPTADAFVPSFLKQKPSPTPTLEMKSDGVSKTTPDEKKKTLAETTQKMSPQEQSEETPAEKKRRKKIRTIKKKLRDIGKLDEKIQSGVLKRISEPQRMKLRRKFELECELRDLEEMKKNIVTQSPDNDDDNFDDDHGKASLQDYQRLCCLGTGSFGKVLQVRHHKTGKIYAMKIIKKNHVSLKKVETSTMLERDVLVKVRHPFIVKLRHAFQSDEKLYLVMTYVSGGELFWHLHDQGAFNEDVSRFYSAELVLALDYLHSLDIIHRDIRPENLLLGHDGHLIVTDFGLAKALSRSNEKRVDQFNKSELEAREKSRQEKKISSTTVSVTTTTTKRQRTATLCGAEEYMAPEMIAGGGYGKSVDWWSLGVLLYEMLTGSPPFTQKGKGASCEKLFKMILNERVKLPSYLTRTCHGILRGLLERNVQRRLGCFKSTMFKKGGVDAIKMHPFFDSIDWNKLYAKKLRPPIVRDVQI